jgi:hypothetical protein
MWPTAVCLGVCQRRCDGVVECNRARLPSSAMVVGLVASAASLHYDDDAGENTSFLWTVSMAPLASCPS